MATYYVTQTAQNAGDGNPYTDSMSVATHNGSTFAANDIVYLCDTINSQVTLPSSGTAGNEIVYRGDYAGHACTITRGSQATGAGDGINMNNKDYIIVRGMTIHACQIGINFGGGEQACKIMDNTIYDCQKGIATQGTGHIIGPEDGVDANTLGNDVYNCNGRPGNEANPYTNGLDINSANDTIIRYNKMYGDATNGIDGVVVQGDDGIIIEYNEIYSHNHAAGEDGIDVKDSDNVVIRYNKIYDNRSQGINWQGGENLDIYCNSIYENGSYNDRNGIVLRPDNANASGTINIIANLVFGNYGRGLHVSQGDLTWTVGTVLNITNNTFYGNNSTDVQDSDIEFTNYPPDKFRNNIIYGTITQILLENDRGAASDISNNTWYYSGAGDAKIDQAGTDYTATTVDTEGNLLDPKFTNAAGSDFTLVSTSPCISAAEALGAAYDDCLDPINTDWTTSPLTVAILDQDVAGGALWDIGAYAYVGAPQNLRPNSVIDTPEGDLYFTSSPQTVSFTGTGTDSESDAMTYLWDFDGMATNSTDADPGNVEISGSIPSTKTVTFTVSDAGGADPTPATITVHWVEDVAADPVNKMHYKLDSGALTTDSSGNGNTLTNNGVDETTGKIDGGGSWVAANSDNMTIADGDTSSGTPLKSGESNSDFTICFWMKPDILPVGTPDYLFNKYNIADDARSIAVFMSATDQGAIIANLGHTAGTTFEALTHDGNTVAGQIYHVSVSYEDTGKTGKTRIWDDTAQDFLQDTGGGDNAVNTFTNNISITAADWYFGASYNTGVGIEKEFDGVMDDLRFYTYKLTEDETDAVRSNQYPVSSIQSVFAQSNDGTYKADDVIYLIVRFNKAVTITGAPQFICETGASDIVFSCSSENISTDIVFTGTVLADMETADLAISSGSIDLNGGTIKYGASPDIDAYLTFPTSGPVNGYHQDSIAETDELDENAAIIIDTSQPTVFSIAEISGGAGTYTTGDTFYIDITSNGDDWNIDGPWTNCVLTGSMHPANVTMDYFSGAYTDTIRMQYTVQAGDRITEFVFPNDTSFSDGDSTLHDAGSNNAVLTLPGVDPGSIVVAGEMSVNVSAGETYTSIMNFLATYDHLVPDDAITYSAATTETSFVAAGAGSSGHPVVINGEGYTITYTNGATFGQDYYTLNRIKYGSEITISGNNVTANYGLITSGWIKTETGTGIVINNHTVVGTAVLDIDVSTAINNCIVKDCALASGITLTPYNTIFYESKATIESDGGTVDATGAATCVFSADPLFRDETGGNYRLQFVSPGYNAGKDVSLTEDFIGRVIIGTSEIGAYEAYLRRGRHRLR